MCRRLIINAGIKKVITRIGENDNDYVVTEVRDWVFNDDSLDVKFS
jgi:deoxycytidylate deaminase